MKADAKKRPWFLFQTAYTGLFHAEYALSKDIQGLN
jgi:hypothetical protein